MEFLRFIDIAMASLREPQTQIEISKRLALLDSNLLEEVADEMGKILY